MSSSPSFERQRKHIGTWVEDINEEIVLNKKLLENLKNHAQSLMEYINNVPYSERFPAIFAEANFCLLKYNQILVEINCKLEALLIKEMRQTKSICVADYLDCVRSLKSAGNQEKCDRNVTCASQRHVEETQTQVPCQVVEDVDLFSSDNQIESCRDDCDNGKNEVIQKNTLESEEKNNIVEKKANVKEKEMDDSKIVSSEVVKTDVQLSCDNCVKPDVIVNEVKNVLGKTVGRRKKKINKMFIKFQKYEGCVTHIESIFELYVYFKTDDKLGWSDCEKELSLHLKKYKFPNLKKHKKNSLGKKEVKKKLGVYALMLSNCSVFHRVKIMNWNLKETNDLVTVQLVDTGETKSVNFNDLHPIPESCMKYPAFATRCHLSQVPQEIDKIVATDLLRNWISENKDITIVVNKEKKMSNIPKSLAVVIYDKSGTRCFNNYIIEKLNIGTPEEADELLDKWDPMTEAYESTMNIYELDLDHPEATIYGYVSKDYQNVCTVYGNTGKCYKKECRKEHVLLDSKGFTTDKEEVYIRAFNPLEISKIDSFSVHITHIVSPTKFYCVMTASHMDDKQETLFSLNQFINQEKNISEMKKLAIPPGVGQVVLAKCVSDFGWFRARVLSVVPELDECTVLAVDYGGTTKVHFSNIRAIEPQYLHLPFQAILCEINGIQNKENTYQSALEYLKKIWTNIFIVHVVSIVPSEQPHLIVDLYTCEGENLAEMLLANNLVVTKTNLHFDDSSAYLPG